MSIWGKNTVTLLLISSLISPPTFAVKSGIENLGGVVTMPGDAAKKRKRILDSAQAKNAKKKDDKNQKDGSSDDQNAYNTDLSKDKSEKNASSANGKSGLLFPKGRTVKGYSYDEKAKVDFKPKGDLANGGDGKGDGGGGGGGGTPPNETKPKHFWLPMCFFIDPDYKEDYVRKMIKTVVDDYAACDVAIDVRSITLKPGTYSRDDADNLNANSRAHCNFKQFYSNPNLYGSGQTHPHSLRASDKMCDKPLEYQEKLRRVAQGEPESKVFDVAGCAKQPGEYSIVDWQAGGEVASHEFGHNIGRPGRGGDELENLGEKNEQSQKNEFKTPGGRGLQLKHSPVDHSKDGQSPPPEGQDAKGGYTPLGCLSLQGGSNPNDQMKIPYEPNRFETYYKRETDPEKQLDFNGRARLFLPPPGQPPNPGAPPSPPIKIASTPDGGGSAPAADGGGSPGGSSGMDSKHKKGSGGLFAEGGAKGVGGAAAALAAAAVAPPSGSSSDSSESSPTPADNPVVSERKLSTPGATSFARASIGGVEGYSYDENASVSFKVPGTSGVASSMSGGTLGSSAGVSGGGSDGVGASAGASGLGVGINGVESAKADDALDADFFKKMKKKEEARKKRGEALRKSEGIAARDTTSKDPQVRETPSSRERVTTQ